MDDEMTPSNWIDGSEIAKQGQRILDLEAALREIAKGEGAFSRDPLTFATNCIESMKQIAQRALEASAPGGSSPSAVSEGVNTYDNSPTDPHHGGKVWNP